MNFGLLLLIFFGFFFESFHFYNQSLFFVDSHSREINEDGTSAYPYHTLAKAINSQNLMSNNITFTLKTSSMPYEFKLDISTQNSLLIVSEG